MTTSTHRSPSTTLGDGEGILMATTDRTTTTPTAPHDPPSSRWQSIAWIVGPTLVILLIAGLLYALVLREPAVTTPVVEAPAPVDEVAPPPAQDAAPDPAPAPVAPVEPASPEESARADIEARYAEWNRVSAAFTADPPTTVEPAGLIIDTVSVGTVRTGTVLAYNVGALQNNPIKAIQGENRPVDYEISDISLFSPRDVDGRSDVQGIATLDACEDLRDVVALDAAGNPIDVPGSKSFNLTRYTFSLQPNPANTADPTAVLWYVEDGRTLWEPTDPDLPSVPCPGAFE